MLKTFTTNIAITSSERKLDALRSGGAMKLPRSDLDKKGPLCKLIRNSRERVRVRERAPLRCHRRKKLTALGGVQMRSGRCPCSRAETARGEARARHSWRHLGGVGRVVEEHLALDGPGALWMSCSRSGQGIGTGVVSDGDRPLDWSHEHEGECWSLS
jgi:hypothetical protein